MRKLVAVLLAVMMIALLAAPCAMAKDPVGVDPDAPCTCWGDMDGDKKVSSADARLVLRQSVGLEHYPEEATVKCDIDKDNKISSSDARMVLRLSVGLEKFPAHEVLTVYGKDVTCTEPGLTDGTYCVICEQELIPQEEIPAPGHTVVVDEAVAATCTEDGLTEGSHCSVCETVFVAQEAVPALGHKPVAVPTEERDVCEEEQVCERCNIQISPMRKHTYAANAFVSAEKGITCTHCGKTVIPSFNDLVNVLKEEEYTYTMFSKTTTVINDPKFTGIMLALKPMFEEEFKESLGEATEYTDLEDNIQVNSDNFEVIGSDKVSLLTDDDLQSVTMETVSSFDFLASLPDSFTSTRGRDNDLKQYKDLQPGELLKVTVNIKPERYSEVKDPSGSEHIKNAFSSYTSLVSSAMNDFNTFDEDFIKCDCDCLSTAKVVYYFDKATLAPVAAFYDVLMDLDQKMSLYITQAGEASKLSTGSMSFKINTDLTNYFFFDSTVPA